MYRQHYPGVGDSDVGLREAGGRSRRTGVRPHRPGREAGEKWEWEWDGKEDGTVSLSQRACIRRDPSARASLMSLFLVWLVGFVSTSCITSSSDAFFMCRSSASSLLYLIVDVGRWCRQRSVTVQQHPLRFFVTCHQSRFPLALSFANGAPYDLIGRTVPYDGTVFLYRGCVLFVPWYEREREHRVSSG